MIKADFHVHSSISFDCETQMEEMILAAIEKGLGAVCFTDHLNLMDGEVPGKILTDSYPLWQKSYADIGSMREKYGGQIEILLGMELSEINLQPKRAKMYAADENLDFVIGATHILPEMQDFCYLDFADKATCEALTAGYLDEILHTAKCNVADVIAHIGYSNRYMAQQSFTVDLLQYTDRLEAIFKTLIENGRGIELNTSGLRQAYGGTFPCLDLLSMYRKLGGEIVTIGSDAHFAKHVGSHFDEGISLLQQAGFSYYTIFRKRQPVFVPML